MYVMRTTDVSVNDIVYDNHKQLSQKMCALMFQPHLNVHHRSVQTQSAPNTIIAVSKHNLLQTQPSHVIMTLFVQCVMLRRWLHALRLSLLLDVWFDMVDFVADVHKLHAVPLTTFLVDQILEMFVEHILFSIVTTLSQSAHPPKHGVDTV